MKKKIHIFSIILYALAGLLAVYSIWVIINCYEYISQMMAAQQLTFAGNEYDIVNFYMSNCSQYVLFAIIIFTLGWIIQKNLFCFKREQQTDNQLPSPVHASVHTLEEGANEENFEEGFEEWFKNNNQ
ncbi:hypothetical protein [uncultured Clostridium sp.]|uniref:hypothetical protein n=1 Tax=uncultured Clostridium sp. TaxID=59620 RepID=UPI0028E3EF8A|nr:hypothetical protein [uncultured Clostridium sp.]